MLDNVKKELIEVERTGAHVMVEFAVPALMLERLREVKCPHVAGAIWAKLKTGGSLGIALVMDEETYKTHTFSPNDVTAMKDMFVELLCNMFGERTVAEGALMQMLREAMEAIEEQETKIPDSHNGN